MLGRALAVLICVVPALVLLFLWSRSSVFGNPVVMIVAVITVGYVTIYATRAVASR